MAKLCKTNAVKPHALYWTQRSGCPLSGFYRIPRIFQSTTCDSSITCMSML